MNHALKNQQRTRSLPEGEYRQRCYDCYRPVGRCFCDSIPHVENQTDVLILQHRRERTHAFNTARIVKKALAKCKLIFDRNDSFSDRELPIKAGAALLYPGKDARLVDELSPDEMPQQLILIDGTWDHAKAMFRDIPQLHSLPLLKLNPSSPGQYRIRREPTATSLSTIEATVQALQQLEPATEGLDRLLDAFDTMVSDQLAHPNASYDHPIPRQGALKNVPRTLLQDPSNIVVAYGEATPTDCGPDIGWQEFNRNKKESAKLPPVFWAAQRLGGNEEDSFVEYVAPERQLTSASLAHMELTALDFESAISRQEFIKRWADFLNEDDLLVVSNQRTIKLLRNCGAMLPRYVSLKSVNYDPQGDRRGLTEFLASVSVAVEEPCHKGRAGKRLANSVALTHFLRDIGNGLRYANGD